MNLAVLRNGVLNGNQGDVDLLVEIVFEHANHCRIGVRNSAGTVSADVEALERKQIQNRRTDAPRALVVLGEGRAWANESLAPKKGAGPILVPSQHILKSAVRERQKSWRVPPQSAESSGTEIMAGGGSCLEQQTQKLEPDQLSDPGCKERQAPSCTQALASKWLKLGCRLTSRGSRRYSILESRHIRASTATMLKPSLDPSAT